MENCGMFCKVFGDTPRNRIIEFFLEMRELDFAISDVIEETGMNKATTYNTVRELIEAKIITPTRKVGKTQLYKLNIEKPEVKTLIKAFDYALAAVVEKHTEKQIVIRH